MKSNWLVYIVSLFCGCSKAGRNFHYTNSCMENGDYEDAIVHFNQVIQAKPRFTAAYIGRGWAKLYLEQPSGACFDFCQAISLSPDNSEAYLGRAWTNYSLDKFLDCINDCNKALENKTRIVEAEIYFLRGISRLDNFDYSGYEDIKKASAKGYEDAKSFLQEEPVSGRGAQY